MQKPFKYFKLISKQKLFKTNELLIVPFIIQNDFGAWVYNKPAPSFRKTVIKFVQPIYTPEAQNKEIVKNKVQFVKDSLERK